MLTDRLAVGERPRAPWHPLPLSELLILIGAIGTVVGLLRGESGLVLMIAGLGAVLIGTGGGDAARAPERLPLADADPHAATGDRSVHGDRADRCGHRPRSTSRLLVLDAALAVVLFKRLRARFLRARRERTFAAKR